jgi:hypothetical protein
MSDGGLFSALGKPVEFTHQQFETYPTEFIAQLKASGVLQRDYSEYWYCEYCETDHPYQISEENVRKQCPNNYLGLATNIDASELECWIINWARLKHAFCGANQYAPFEEECPLRKVFPLGYSSTSIAMLSDFKTVQEVNLFVSQARYTFEQFSNWHLINLRPIVGAQHPLTASTELIVSFFIFSEVLSLNWLIKSENYSSEQEPKIVLDLLNNQVTYQGKTIQWPAEKTYLFKVISILMQANGQIVSYSAFEGQYYQGKKKPREGLISHLPTYVSQAEQKLQQFLDEIHPGEKFFEVIKETGYRLKEKILPVLVRSSG